MRVFCTSLQVAAEVLLALAVGNYENQVRSTQHRVPCMVAVERGLCCL
jgi:hypothetical protein